MMWPGGRATNWHKTRAISRPIRVSARISARLCQTLSLRLRAGTPLADPNNGWAAFVIVVLIAEMTRRVAGMAGGCRCRPSSPVPVQTIIVMVISLIGVGARLSNLLFGLTRQSTLLALIFAMMISVILRMEMPVTAASLVAPGLIDIGITPLIAHFFVFDLAVVSAITSTVALAAYAGAAIAGSKPMRISVTSFKVGLAAVIVPFMFFYSPGRLIDAPCYGVLRNLVTALIGVYTLAGSVRAWFIGPTGPIMRLLLVGAVCMISGDWRTDLLGIAIGGALMLRGWQKGNETA